MQSASMEGKQKTPSNGPAVFGRQTGAGDNLAMDQVQAAYRDAVLWLVIPVAE